jgi:hypothetical protein
VGNAKRILVEKSGGKRPLGRPKRRCEVNVKIHFKEKGWKGVDSINLAQGRDKWPAGNVWFQKNAKKNCRLA